MESVLAWLLSLPLLTIQFLDEAGGFGDEANIATLLVLESPHLRQDGRTGGFFVEGALFPERRKDDLVESFSGEDASECDQRLP